MILQHIISYLEELAPLSYQETYDNAGLIVGDPHQRIQSAIVALDCTEAVVEEAIRMGANLIVAHHPIVFKGLRRFTNDNYVQRVIAKAIKHDIAIYAIHTNLDNVSEGVNAAICQRIGIQKPVILAPKTGLLRQLAVYVPRDYAEPLRAALFQAGAGDISQYSECSFNIAGEGTFKPNTGAQPFSGEVGSRSVEPEMRIEVLYPVQRERKILMSMFEHHPYEEVAYNIYALENRYQEVGSGMIGQLEQPMDELEFMAHLKTKMQLEVIRHTALLGRPITRVAVCGGAGSFLLQQAIASGADVFITADYKYHEFFDAEHKIMIADVGHFESEQFTQHLLLERIQKKFPNFAIRLTGENTNPIKYYF